MPLLPGLSRGDRLPGTGRGVSSLPAYSQGRGARLPRLLGAPAAPSRVAEPSCLQGPQEVAPGSWDWGGAGRGGAGEGTPHQESQRQGCALAQEPPPAPPLPPGGQLLSPLALPCAAWSPTLGSQEGTQTGENHPRTLKKIKKTVGPSPTSAHPHSATPKPLFPRGPPPPPLAPRGVPRPALPPPRAWE